MGTRHLIAVVKDGEYKVAQYGQWDGYLEGQGHEIVDFIAGLSFENYQQFLKHLDTVSWASQEDLEAVDKQLEANPHLSLRVNYPELSRDTGSKILTLILEHENLKLSNAITFAADSLFCEYAYVVDCDNEVLEVYEGFQEGPIDESERFYFLTLPENQNFDRISKSTEYRPVKLLAKLPFNGIGHAFQVLLDEEQRKIAAEEENDD